MDKDFTMAQRSRQSDRKSLRELIAMTASDLQLLKKLEGCKRGSGYTYGKCVTCGQLKPLGELQGGHFISRRHKATILDERNIHPQCVRCNQWLNGNLSEYRKFLGDDLADELKAKSMQVKKFTREELNELRDGFRARIRKEKKRLGMK